MNINELHKLAKAPWTLCDQYHTLPYNGEDSIDVLGKDGFPLFEIDSMPVLPNWENRLGITHMSDAPGKAFIERTTSEMMAIAALAQSAPLLQVTLVNWVLQTMTPWTDRGLVLETRQVLLASGLSDDGITAMFNARQRVSADELTAGPIPGWVNHWNLDAELLVELTLRFKKKGLWKMLEEPHNVIYEAAAKFQRDHANTDWDEFDFGDCMDDVVAEFIEKLSDSAQD